MRLPAKEIERAVELAISNDLDVRTQQVPAGHEAFNIVQEVTFLEDRMQIQIALPKQEAKTITVPYTMRRRGFETKLVIPGNPARTPDLVMIRRVQRALSWVERIKAGESVKAIADSEGISSDFITHNIDLAFLSPEILEAILNGEQRADLTTAKIARRRWPMNWPDQRPQFLP